MDNIIKQCSFLLNNLPNSAKTYLDSRLSREIQEKFEFGYFPNGKELKLLTTFVDEEELIKNELMYKTSCSGSFGNQIVNKLYFENYPLIMPYKDSYGNIIGIVGRCLLPDVVQKDKNISKYKNTQFKKGNHLFGLFENKENILKEDKVFIVEGQFDVIKCYEHNIKNVVCLGSSSMTDYQLCILLRYTKNLVLLLDDDDAGHKGRQIIHSKYDEFADIKDAYLSNSCKDIDEYLSLGYDFSDLLIK